MELTDDDRALGLGMCQLCRHIRAGAFVSQDVRVWRCGERTHPGNELRGLELARDFVERAHRCPAFVELVRR